LVSKVLSVRLVGKKRLFSNRFYGDHIMIFHNSEALQFEHNRFLEFHSEQACASVIVSRGLSSLDSPAITTTG